MTQSGSEVADYLDTSALVKLVVREAETDALIRWLGSRPGPAVTCDLARVELVRAVRRTRPEAAQRAREVLDGCVLLTLSPELCESAGRLDPPELRSLDALHLAASLALTDELDSLVTYDVRLGQAAAGCGIEVVAPG